MKLGPVVDIVTLSFATGLKHFKSQGNEYTHIYNNWYYIAELMANYKVWSLFALLQNYRNHFYGEKLWYGENIHMIGVKYIYKQMSFGVIFINPFLDHYKV